MCAGAKKIKNTPEQQNDVSNPFFLKIQHTFLERKKNSNSFCSCFFFPFCWQKKKRIKFFLNQRRWCEKIVPLLLFHIFRRTSWVSSEVPKKKFKKKTAVEKQMERNEFFWRSQPSSMFRNPSFVFLKKKKQSFGTMC